MADPLVIQAGTLRNSISIQARSTTQTDSGQPVDTWTTVLSTRCSIRTLTLSERYSASGLEGDATHRIVCRYQSSVPLSSGMRILFGARIFILQAVENVLERNRVLVLLALEQAPTQ